MTDIPADFHAFVWAILLGLGGFLSKHVWDWWRARSEDTREFNQTQAAESREYHRKYEERLLEVLTDNARSSDRVDKAVEGMCSAVNGMMRYLEDMAHRDERVQHHLMLLQERTKNNQKAIADALEQIAKRQDQTASELFSYLMGRVPTRETDYTSLIKRVDEQQEELEELRRKDDEERRYRPDDFEHY